MGLGRPAALNGPRAADGAVRFDYSVKRGLPQSPAADLGRSLDRRSIRGPGISARGPMWAGQRPATLQGIHPLSALDSSFLRVETATGHMHVGWLSHLDLPHADPVTLPEARELPTLLSMALVELREGCERVAGPPVRRSVRREPAVLA